MPVIKNIFIIKESWPFLASVPFSLTPAICRQEIQIKVKSITSDDKSMTIETSRMSALSMGKYSEKFESS